MAATNELLNAATALVKSLESTIVEIKELVDDETPNKLVVSLSVSAEDAKLLHQCYKRLALMTGEHNTIQQLEAVNREFTN
jgi:hypothetical protein